ncbi:MAG: hypothetical protein ABIL16_05645 [candidate division WOR-3 bacterium]
MREQLLKFLDERFGIGEDVFKGFKFVQRGDDVWIMSQDIPDNLKDINRAGLRFARGVSRNIKITTAVIQLFGKYATKNVVNISEEHLWDFLAGRDIIVGKLEGVERGQVIVKFGEDVLGLGLYDGEKIKNQIPKARRIV